MPVECDWPSLLSGGEGWADVWKRGHFGWEYKGKRKNLEAAFGQLQQWHCHGAPGLRRSRWPGSRTR